MKLLPIDRPELVELVVGWLSAKENNQWLDLSGGGATLTPAWLKIMVQRRTDVLRVFTRDPDDRPIGVVGFTNVHQTFKTALVWIAVGDKSFRSKGYATRAGSEMLTIGFEELGLHCIYAWIVDGNPSIKILKRLGFNFIGRQRQCHCIDGRPYDRLWFDLLAPEHKDPSRCSTGTA